MPDAEDTHPLPSTAVKLAVAEPDASAVVVNVYGADAVAGENAAIAAPEVTAPTTEVTPALGVI